MSPISIHTEHTGNEIILRLVGGLDRRALDSLKALAVSLREHKGRSIFLDMAHVTHMDGAGMLLLVEFCTRVSVTCPHICFRGLPNNLHPVFDLTKLNAAGQVCEPGASSVQPAPNWSAPFGRVNCTHPPASAVNLNVHGRQLTSPVQGFGRMWLRTYRTDLPASLVSPERLMSFWKANFSSLWPPGNAIYLPKGGVLPGAVGLINLAMPLGLNLATGAAVIHADDTSFTLMTVQGHMFSGFINFSAYLEGRQTIAQTQALIRPNDLLYEVSFWVKFGPQAEDVFWTQTLQNLSRQAMELARPSRQATPAPVQISAELIDHRFRWRAFPNIWYNAGVRSGLYQVLKPLRKLFKSA